MGMKSRALAVKTEVMNESPEAGNCNWPDLRKEQHTFSCNYKFVSCILLAIELNDNCVTWPYDVICWHRNISSWGKCCWRARKEVVAELLKRCRRLLQLNIFSKCFLPQPALHILLNTILVR